MDILKHTLDKLCSSCKEYRYDQVDDLGEIYQKGDILPVALIDYSRTTGLYFIKFRLGLQSYNIAKLTKELTLVEPSLIFEDDFLIHEEYGYLYGDDARQAFIERIQASASRNKETNTHSDVIFVSTDPIFTYGKQTFGKTKIEKFWEMNDGL